MNLYDLITQDLYGMEDLGLAYRKAKVDLFYSARPARKTLSEFEGELPSRLEALRHDLQNGEAPSVYAGRDRKTYSLVPKKIHYAEEDSDVISSQKNHIWKALLREKEKPVAEFRVMEALPIEFHVFAALWILKVGHKFEEKLSEAARGNRLRRTEDKRLNPLSLGSTVPYLHAYCRWRDDGIEAMKTGLKSEKSIVGITADVGSFYHKLDVSFMIKESFLSEIGVELTESEGRLHTLFIQSLQEWARQTPLGTGLPVGLAASSLIANVALFGLDRFIEEEVVPLYYGRYVDDIILVMENGTGFKSSREVWDWLCERSSGCLSWDSKDHDKLIYKKDYLEGSEIAFENGKNKTFLLSGRTGHSILASIRHEIQARTSEWRSLPDLPSSEQNIEAGLLTAIQKGGISADSLRKADKVSVRRAGFALKLRDFEAYSRALPADQWETQRHAFFEAFAAHVLVLPTFFDFYTYLSRVLALAVNCGDLKQLREMLRALDGVCGELYKIKTRIKGMLEGSEEGVWDPLNHAQSFRAQISLVVEDAALAAMPLRISREKKREWIEFIKDGSELFPNLSLAELQSAHRDLIRRDLGYRPLKLTLMPPAFSGIRRHEVSKKSISRFSKNLAEKWLPSAVVEGVSRFEHLQKLPDATNLSEGLLFPTRPPGLQELYLTHSDPFSMKGASDIAMCLLAFRGFKPTDQLPQRSHDGKMPFVHIPFGEGRRKQLRIAVASWKTDLGSWAASITSDPDPDSTRLPRLNDLLNAVLSSRTKIDYLILPEVALPAHWFLAAAGKLQGKGISLVSGIAYQLRPSSRVANQVWAALSHDALGFPTTMIYRQDKQTPAIHEENELFRIAGKTLVPIKRWTTPPLIDHGGFLFSILVCSELTNIAHRAALRGRIDALFVPEWNQDTASFSSLVESAALDIHAFIVQCNHRDHGDSRIRAPYKDSWTRDIIRVKGGLEDYFVVGEIDVEAIRSFQSSHRSPRHPFKPVPDGFEISHRRKTLPIA